MKHADGPRGRRRLLGWGIPVAAVVVAGAVAAALLLHGSGGGTEAASATSSAATGSTPLPFPGSASPSTPSVSPTPLTEPSAALVVSRPGVPASARTVAGSTAAFTAPASWADGATVRVTKAHQQVTSGSGPGTLAGQPQTVFSLELTNGAKAPLAVSNVVVQARYGSGRAVAAPLYDDTTVDFSGTVQPGRKATAVYSFAIPSDQTGDVLLTVDVDGRHFPAVFSGRVPVS